MMDWPNHSGAWREWRNAMNNSRMHHGWILAGKNGLGKHDFAIKAARELVAEKGVHQPEKDHPDILHLTHLPKDDKEERKREKGDAYETKRNITVGQIRSIQQRLTTRPTLGTRRAIIVDPADDMEKSASNALLKSLEEPPIGTFFLLITHRPARLLPTIRSRCRMARFGNLTPGMLEQMLRETAPQADENTLKSAIATSGGSPGAALTFIEQDLTPIAQIFDQIMSSGDHDLSHRGALIKAVGARPNRLRIQAILQLAQTKLAGDIAQRPPAAQLAAVDAYQEMVILAGQAPTYNFDAGLLVMETGGLLARAAQAST